MVSRRGFVKGTMLAGFAALTASSLATAKSLLGWCAVTQVGTVNEGFIFTAAKGTLWYTPLLGQEALVNQFPGIGYGATALWRALFDDQGKIIPGTGSPALVMKLDESKIITPPDAPEPLHPQGFVAVFNTCVHLCCNPALNLVHTVIESPPPSQDVLAHPDSTLSGPPVVDPEVGVIYCPCHHSQYDPFRYVWEPDADGRTHPNNPVRYLGVNWVWGPAQRALPAIPLDIKGGKLIGLNTHPEWYRGYCGLAGDCGH